MNKKSCDNICQTCTLNQQVSCSLAVSKANNKFSEVFNERLDSIENLLTIVVNNLTTSSVLQEEPKKEELEKIVKK